MLKWLLSRPPWPSPRDPGTATDGAATGDRREPARDHDAQRLLFAPGALAGDPAAADLAPLERLAPGRALLVDLPAHASFPVGLGRHRFELVAGPRWLLVDARGHDHHVQGPRCVIGRSRECDLVIDAGFRAVSRRHLLVEVDGACRVQLTDLSSAGTFVPSSCLADRLH